MIINNKYLLKGLDFAGKYLHAPEQRMILGATALATQPVIDAKNKEVDEKTRKTSVARTISKIMAGTIVGVAVRYAGVWGAKTFTQYDLITNPKNAEEVWNIVPKPKRSQLFPLISLLETKFPISKKVLDSRFNKYTKAMGLFAATIAMVFTNFLIDAPLTKVLTKYFSKKLDVKTEKNEVQK